MGAEDPKHLPGEDTASCFLEATRPCSANCMAFKTVGTDNDQLDVVQQHCVILSSVERAGRGLIALASIAASVAKRKKDQEDDAKRTAATGTPPAQGTPR